MGSRKVSLADKLKKVDEIQLQAKKGQGVDAFFTNTSGEESVETPNNSTVTDTSMGTCTQPSTITDTTPIMDTSSVLDSLLDNSENFVRCVAYLRKDQSDFVKDLSKQLTKKNKGKRIKESEIFRIAIDMLMDTVKK